jgi:hypothetical protein
MWGCSSDDSDGSGTSDTSGISGDGMKAGVVIVSTTVLASNLHQTQLLPLSYSFPSPSLPTYPQCFPPSDLHSIAQIYSHMLRNLRLNGPPLTRTLALVGHGIGNPIRPLVKLSSRPSPQRLLQSSYISARHCSSSSDDMASKHLEESHERIFQNNREWVASMKAEDPQFFEKLTTGQSPEYL